MFPHELWWAPRRLFRLLAAVPAVCPGSDWDADCQPSTVWPGTTANFNICNIRWNDAHSYAESIRISHVELLDGRTIGKETITELLLVNRWTFHASHGQGTIRLLQ